ncbi:MAG: DUF6493 family protein [Planctomycetaceae bacterium]
MKPEEYRELIASRDIDLMVSKFKPLSEKQRSSLEKEAVKLLKEARKEDQRLQETRQYDDMVNEGWALVGIMAVASWSEARKQLLYDLAEKYYGPDDRERIKLDQRLHATIQILIDRKPEWIPEYVEKNIKCEYWSGDLTLLLKLVEAGLAPHPVSEEYLRKLSNEAQPHYIDFDRFPRVLEEDIWKFFSMESPPFWALSKLKNIDLNKWRENLFPDEQEENQEWMYSRNASWPRLFINFSHQGRIDRQKLISGTLFAFQNQKEATLRKSLLLFLELLEINTEELIIHQGEIVNLLSSSHTNVVTYAISQLESLRNSDQLDISGLNEVLPEVFAIDSKAGPLKAITFLGKVTNKKPELQQQFQPSIEAALKNPQKDVQLAVVKLLDKWLKQNKSLRS